MIRRLERALLGALGAISGELSPTQRAALQARGLSPSGDAFSGQLSGYEVRYQRLETGEGASHRWETPMPIGLSLWPRAGLSPAEQETGDRLFDRHFSILWRSAADLTWLASPVRAALVRASDLSPRLEEGALSVQSRVFRSSDLDVLLSIARAFAERPADAASRAGELLSDPMPPVRWSCLRALAQRDPKLVLPLARSLLRDEDEGVRAISAVLLEDASALWLAATSRAVPPDLRRLAADHLARCGSVEQRRHAGIELARDPALVEAAIPLLISVGPSAESALVEIVERADGEALRRVAAALAAEGSPRVLPALRERKERLSLLQSGLSAALDEAIDAICARTGAGPGALSIVAESGALSVAAEPGALSRPDQSRR